ncbi:tumor necrosis factor receptor superfamily member 1B isoform X1 [Tupaia chinensis]|uniref:tumor necrosis factor receptor superfamily member 1B isoform X1 n=1 Tax=Tupaia chinensis TaxID=246437 RepID=UPI0003C8DAB3|nr:tumor necrosis factor receptor superfamily member 1B isoform X1 [Tupaia chinensis]
MAPAAVWAALAVGLQLWAAGNAEPSEPRNPCQEREYLDQTTKRCCSMCPPGHSVRKLCTKTSDTICVPCEDSTYTQFWNWIPGCFSCDPPCSPGQVEIQACTLEQNRICTCKPGWYCVLKRQVGCRQCVPLSKCLPGHGVTTQATATSDVKCSACPPGTFSDTTSSTDTCRPHRICSLVATPGNASTDAVCASVFPTQKKVPGPVTTSQPVSTRFQHKEPTPGPSTTPSTSLSPNPKELRTGSISLPIGLIVGVASSLLIIIVLVNCVILAQKKKRPSCLQGEAKVPHLQAEKAQNVLGTEQQHLLTTAPSSSSSSLESSASASDRSTPTRNQPQAPGMAKASGSGEARASSGSSESSPGGHGTQVNVTCIVNVCSSSDHGSQCSSQASCTMGDMDTRPSGSPKEEQVPFSKEEHPFQSQPGTPETLLQSAEEKPLPLGVPDAGMKPSHQAGVCYVPARAGPEPWLSNPALERSPWSS